MLLKIIKIKILKTHEANIWDDFQFLDNKIKILNKDCEYESLDSI